MNNRYTPLIFVFLHNFAEWPENRNSWHKYIQIDSIQIIMDDQVIALVDAWLKWDKVSNKQC